MAAIRHIEFWVSDLNASLKFYQELFSYLDWEKVDDNGFACDGTKIYFIENKSAISAQKAFGPRHICFTATNKETVDSIAHLPSLASKILHGPAELHPGGSYMVVFTDPDDYVLEIACK